MKNVLRILTGLLLFIAMPIILFAFFPKLASTIDQQSWSQTLYTFLIGIAILALFLGFDLLNRVQVYKAYLAESAEEKENFWHHKFALMRLGFLRSGLASILLMSLVLVMVVFGLMLIPKAPQGNWHLWTIKILGMGTAIGVFSLLNAVLFLKQGKRVILGITDKKVGAPREKTWQDILFQIRPTFMDAEVDLKEDFDGITELDNPAPPWFMWLFYATILTAAIYFTRYTWLHYGPTQEEEYSVAYNVIKANQKKSAGNVDENNVTLETDKANLAAAAELFQKKCAVCHGEKAEGKNGPNLTDAFWLHGGSVKEVFKTIKYGVIEKGMISWADQIPPLQIKAIASYILSLQGSKPPNAKAPEGVEGGGKANPRDSTSANKM